MGILPVLYLVGPVSIISVARRIQASSEVEPDVLCALEHLEQTSGIITAQRQRAVNRLKSMLESEGGRRSAWWALLLPLWCLPIWNHGLPDLNLTFGKDVSQYEASAQNGRKDADVKPLNQQTKGVVSPKRQPPPKAQTRARAMGTKGQETSGKGSGNKMAKRSVLEPVGSDVSISFTGVGAGGERAGGKLTQAPKSGKLKLLVKDRLDPSEKYPVEYREAIRKWFLKQN